MNDHRHDTARPLTRRQFTAAGATAVALTVLGCAKTSEESDVAATPKAEKKKDIDPPTEPFTVGTPSQYAAAGVYADLSQTRRVFLVSDGKQLVALANICTHKFCALDYMADENLFECPCHESRFAIDGTNLPDVRAKRPLERWAIEIKSDQNTPQVWIDPTRSFRRDLDQWSDPASFATL